MAADFTVTKQGESFAVTPLNSDAEVHLEGCAWHGSSLETDGLQHVRGSSALLVAPAGVEEFINLLESNHFTVESR